jgi:hypothetical protein
MVCEVKHELTAAITAVISSQPGCLVRNPRTYILTLMKIQTRGSRISTTMLEPILKGDVIVIGSGVQSA